MLSIPIQMSIIAIDETGISLVVISERAQFLISRNEPGWQKAML